jgi:hypothetical protein
MPINHGESGVRRMLGVLLYHFINRCTFQKQQPQDTHPIQAQALQVSMVMKKPSL